MPINTRSITGLIRKVNIKEEQKRLLDEFKIYIKTVSIVSLCYNIIFILVFIFNWLLPTDLFHYGSLNTSLTFNPQEFFEEKAWSLFTYTWVNINLLSLVFNLTFFHLVAHNLEKKWGTLNFIYLTVILFTLIPALLDTFLYLVSPKLPTTLYGNFVIFFTFLVIEILEMPKVSFFGAFTFPATVYPILVLIVLLIISFESFLHGVLGALMGYLFSFNYFSLLIPSRARVERFEKRFLPNFIYNNSHYCTAEDSANFALPLYNIVTSSDLDPSEGSTSQSYLNSLTNADPLKYQSSGHRLG